MKIERIVIVLLLLAIAGLLIGGDSLEGFGIGLVLGLILGVLVGVAFCFGERASEA
ncbi:hypothetical protein [Bradyrhizobium sp. Ai1a-2]|uniref:hypothetical protein n=1 Tax=Bradyrhizobium sp. Ai1a-2 TaxID=196490 RepID=UPI000419C045|nr:hypothetical protein [Bradyrhizobium sp. Ai1a-2]